MPTYTEGDKAALQIKKTSWKTVKKFIKALEKERLLRSKDRGGETSVLAVDFTHDAIETFSPYPIPGKASAPGDADKTGEPSASPSTLR